MSPLSPPGHTTIGVKLTWVKVFENDFPALLSEPLPLLPSTNGDAPASPTTSTSPDSFFHSQPVRGRCKVICFHPRHDLTLARMEVDDIVHVVKGWKGIYEEEGRMLRESGGGDGAEGYVQIFEVSRRSPIATPPSNEPFLRTREELWALADTRAEPRGDDGCLCASPSRPSLVPLLCPRRTSHDPCQPPQALSDGSETTLRSSPWTWRKTLLALLVRLRRGKAERARRRNRRGKWMGGCGAVLGYLAIRDTL